MQVSLNNLKHHHEQRFCLKCFKKFQLPLLSSILFRGADVCPECTLKIQTEGKLPPKQVKAINITDIYDVLKVKPHERLEIFLPHEFRSTTDFCVMGYEGSLPLGRLQQFLSHCSKIRLHNIKDMKRHISYLDGSLFPKFNIVFSNITRLQLKGEKINSIEFLQLFDFRNLDDLSLWDNNVVQLKALNKCRFPKLLELHLSHNKINSIDCLARSDFLKLQKISLGFRQSPSFQEYKGLLKLSSLNMKTIYLNYIKFIEFYDKSLHHKYKELHVVSLNNCQYSNGRRNL